MNNIIVKVLNTPTFEPIQKTQELINDLQGQLERLNTKLNEQLILITTQYQHLVS